jgi:hypothetical protein
VDAIIRNAKIDPRRTGDGDWTVESADEALLRAPDFGREFFKRLFRDFSQLRNTMIFLRWSVQSEDVYAICDKSPGGFMVQIDPALEYIIVASESDQGEYGDWGNGEDRVEEALKHVRLCMGGAA